MLPVVVAVLAGMWTTFFSSSPAYAKKETNEYAEKPRTVFAACRFQPANVGRIESADTASYLIPDAKAVSPSDILESIGLRLERYGLKASKGLDDRFCRGSMVLMSTYPPEPFGRGRIDSPASGAKLPIVLALEERDAAAALGISPEHLAKLRKAGHVPHTWLGRSVRYPVDALRVWLDQMTTQPTTEGSEPSPV